MSVNKVILIGNVGRDPEVRYLDSGIAVASLPLATTDRAYTLANGTQVPERTEWHNLVLWRGLAETAEKYVHKGDKLYVEGKIRTRSYDDQTGAKQLGNGNLCGLYGNAESQRNCCTGCCRSATRYVSRCSCTTYGAIAGNPCTR